MIKTIIKETIIVLVLCFVILLILGLMFYEYNPIGKVVPSTVTYTTPNEIAGEIAVEDRINELAEIQNRVYTIDGSDLTKYQKSKNYDPSKENPFAKTPVNEASSENTNTTTETNTQSNTVNNSSTSNTNNNNQSTAKPK